MIGLDEMLVAAAGVVLVGALGTFTLVMLHGWWARHNETRYTKGTLPMRSWLLHTIQAPEVDANFIRRLNERPVRHRVRLLAEAGRQLRGAEMNNIAQIARETGVVAQALRATRSQRWWRRLHAVRVLAAVGGGEDVVPGMLADPNPFVRSEAAVWCGGYGGSGSIRRLLNLMDTPTMLDRIAVIDALVSIGAPAVTPLADRLPHASPEGREAGLTAALGMGDPRFLPVALDLVKDPVVGVRKRAARLLSVLGGEQAVEVLESLLEDEDPSVRATAARALGRMRAWTSAGCLESLLGDPDPDPSRDAAIALGDIGPPGWLILRSCARKGDRAGRLAEAVLEAVQKPLARPVDVHGEVLA